MMRAVRVAQFGGPGVLRVLDDVPIPQPEAGQVLINVKSIGVNPVETYIRAGSYPKRPTLPFTPGLDCAGVVESVGSDVTSLKAGDRVWTWKSSSGSYAEYTTAAEDGTFLLSEKLSYEEGAALCVPFLTAYRALVHFGNAKSGETVLVHGASGGVGVWAVQLGKLLGLKVIGTAGTPDGLEVVRNAGADAAFNHREEGYLEKVAEVGAPDIIVEMLADKNLANDLEILNFGGRVIVVGSRGSFEFFPRLIMAKEAKVCGVMLFAQTPEQSKEAALAFKNWADQGKLRPVVGKRFPLDQVSDAHEQIIGGPGALGRMILTL